MKEQLDQVFGNLDPSMVMYSAIASIILGVAIFLASLVFKKKQKSWWIYVALLGGASVVLNAMRLIGTLS